MDLQEGSSLPVSEKDEPHIIQWLTVPGQPKTKLYRSYRGMLLLCQSPSTFGKPIVTMENYVKWYGIQILHPDGRVESADPGLLNELADRCDGTVMGDHNYHPRLLNELAKEIGGEVCWRSLEMTAGRWVAEIMDGEMEGFPNIDIPRSKEKS